MLRTWLLDHGIDPALAFAAAVLLALAALALRAYRRQGAGPEVPGDGPERRRHPRSPSAGIALEMADASGRVKPYRAWVVDFSRRGLRLAVEEPFAVGTVLRVKPPRAWVVFWWMPVWVRHCRQADHGWEVGCQVLRKLGADTLRRLG